MRITYDVVTKAFDVQIPNLNPVGAVLVAALHRHNRKITFVDLSFGATVTADGVVIYERVFPRAGEKWIETDQDVLWSELVRWSPDHVIEVHAWIENAGERHDAVETFTVPRPPRPYPSWHWDGSAWQAPLPYPDDGVDYQWNEAGQEWQAL